MKAQRILSAIALIALLPAVASAQFTHPRPLQRATDQHLAMLLSRQYERLDQAADDARESNLLTSDGQPLLSAIYAGTAGCYCGNQLTEELWKIRKARLEEWHKHNPASITARLSLAIYPIRYAWFARGPGYSSTVSPSAWKLFRERVEEGRLALLALEPALRTDPGWYEGMLDAALSQHWPRDRYDALVEAALGKHPYYLPVYFAVASYYAPRWYGSIADLRRVIDNATERTRPKMGEILYARLNWSVSTNDMFRNGQTDWKRMKAGFERMVQDHPDPWNVNNFAKFACMASDWETVKHLTATIGEKPIVMAWFDDLDVYTACRTRARR